MTSPVNPLPDMTPGFGSLGRAQALPEALTGEAGVQLLAWLSEDGVTAAHYADAEASFRDYAAGNPGGTPQETRSDLTTILYMRGYQQMPRFMAFLQRAIAGLDAADQANGLADYMSWLARRAAVMFQA